MSFGEEVKFIPKSLILSKKLSNDKLWLMFSYPLLMNSILINSLTQNIKHTSNRTEWSPIQSAIIM